MSNKLPPSIFNDVLGPVMRGPSSSHTAAAVRIGRIIRQFFDSNRLHITVEFDADGSLASTYNSQGTDIGLAAGLLGMDPASEGLAKSLSLAEKEGICLNFKVSNFKTNHPNTFRIEAGEEGGCNFNLIFISTGGGMFELIELNGIPLSIRGDYHENLFLFNLNGSAEPETLVRKMALLFPEHEAISFADKNGSCLINLKTRQPCLENIAGRLSPDYKFTSVIRLKPELPVLSRRNIELPFHNAAGLLKEAESSSRQIHDLALDYECSRGGLNEKKVYRLTAGILTVMKRSIETGLSGTNYQDRILGPQAHKMLNYNGMVPGGKEVKNIIALISAVMETKSSMGVIAAAPTAGACACLPGILIASSKANSINDIQLSKALLTAGLVGVLIAHKSTFAAEECGCQAECGSASAMSAAALVQLAGGSAKQALAAASMALQNLLGMICDPVANRVEVPCLGKNILAGMNALAAANMALSGFDQVIPFDETLMAFDQVGRMLPSELRCTGKGGLSITDSSRELQKRLDNRAFL